MAVDIRPVQKKHHLCRSCLVKCTLRKGVPFPRMGHRESYGKDGAWTYVYFPAEFKEFQEDVAHFITLTGDAAEPRWFFVVDHVALKTSELSLPILQAGFDWTTSNQRAFEHIMHDVKETLFGQYFDEDVEDDVNILKFLTVQLDSKLKDYYFNGDDAKRYNRQLAHIRLAGQKSLLIQLVERDLWRSVAWLLQDCSVETANEEWMILADVTYKGDRYGNTALHAACYEGNLRSLEVLLHHVERYHGSPMRAPWQEDEVDRYQALGPGSWLPQGFGLCDLLDKIKNDHDGRTCLAMAEHEKHWACFRAVAKVVHRLRGTEPKPQHAALSRMRRITEVRIGFTNDEAQQELEAPIIFLHVAEGGSQLEVLADFLSCNGPELCASGAQKLIIRNLHEPSSRSVAEVYQQLPRFKKVTFSNCVVSLESYLEMLMMTSSLLDSVPPADLVLEEVVLGVVPRVAGSDQDQRQQALPIIQLLAQQMIQKLNRPWQVKLSARAFEALQLSLVWQNRLRWIGDVSTWLTTATVAEMGRSSHPLSNNPFNAGIFHAYSWAFGHDSSGLRGCTDIAGALETNHEFFLYVEQLLTTWSEILRSVAEKTQTLAGQTVYALVEELDHVSAAMLHTLNHLASHVSAKRDFILSLIKSFLDSAKSCEKDLGCLTHAQSQGPCVLLQCLHGLDLLKETSLAHSFDWKQHEHAEWAKGALVLVPPERLSEDRTWLVQKLLQRLRTDGKATAHYAIVEWHQLGSLQMDGLVEVAQVNFDSDPDLMMHVATDSELDLLDKPMKFVGVDGMQEDGPDEKTESAHTSGAGQTSGSTMARPSLSDSGTYKSLFTR
ncbi:unnamed protein product [Effrenium voratum]|uniref:ANK_REP_REGION domain-containing protein n=1 Tax=Effrenium voratum TaxID=2562239 RepID=A0AA36NFH9_9DINO|nr:unnamed protein product [Effrenium voratum]